MIAWSDPQSRYFERVYDADGHGACRRIVVNRDAIICLGVRDFLWLCIYNRRGHSAHSGRAKVIAQIPFQ